jgi:release factor glutamine methyltransferase
VLSIQPDGHERAAIVRILLEDAPLSLWQSSVEDIYKWFEQALVKLANGEPIQYIVGKAPFFNYWFKVNASVLIPRPETEELTDLAIRFLKNRTGPQTILDIGTGSGCIAITMALQLKDAQIMAWDISEHALEIARSNGSSNNTTVEWSAKDALEGSSWQELPPLDLIVSNPPYIAMREIGAMDKHVIEHEPQIALFPEGDDNLIFYKVFAREGLGKLKEAGRLYCECSAFTAQEVGQIFIKAGWGSVRIEKDIAGQDRFLIAQP